MKDQELEKWLSLYFEQTYRVAFVAGITKEGLPSFEKLKETAKEYFEKEIKPLLIANIYANKQP